MTKKLEVQGLCIGYGQPILNDISFFIESGEILMIVGANGIGKSTLVQTLLGWVPPLSGEILLADRKKMGFMPQIRPYKPHLPLSVTGFLSLVCWKSPQWKNDVLSSLEIQSLEHLLLSEISFGQWQRVNLAQSLASQPQLLLLDEPTQGLDIEWQKKVYHLLRHYVSTYQAAVCCVSHDTVAISGSADKILCLDHQSAQQHKLSGTQKSAGSFILYHHEHKKPECSC